MYTFAHPLAPTVTYAGDLPASISAFALNHLSEYDVYVVEMQASQHGIGIEVVEKITGNALGVVAIH